MRQSGDLTSAWFEATALEASGENGETAMSQDNKTEQEVDARGVVTGADSVGGTAERDADVVRLVVIDHAGVRHELDALPGWRAMEVIRDWGVGIKAECGGACACGSCHVYVDPEWAERLHPARDDEIQQLDEVFHVENTSRLSCQILMEPAFDGLTLRLAPGSEPE